MVIRDIWPITQPIKKSKIITHLSIKTLHQSKRNGTIFQITFATKQWTDKNHSSESKFKKKSKSKWDKDSKWDNNNLVHNLKEDSFKKTNCIKIDKGRCIRGIRDLFLEKELSKLKMEGLFSKCKGKSKI
jgi:hypothetical protein